MREILTIAALFGFFWFLSLTSEHTGEKLGAAWIAFNKTVAACTDKLQ